MLTKSPLFNTVQIDVLKTVQKSDPVGKFNCIKMETWFDYRGHICMVFEKCGLSLFDFLRKNHYKPFSPHLVQNYGRQLLRAVTFLHTLNLVHTDLKPENILLLSSAYQRVPVSSGSKFTKRVPVDSTIRLIDFGSATFENQYHSTVVSTRHYRAPEVILGMGWSYPCDVWSVGCILVELLTGDALFQTHENLEHLAMMEVVLGPIQPGVIKRADRHAQKYFRGGKELNWPEGSQSRESIRAVRKMERLQDIVRTRLDGVTARNFTDLLFSKFCTCPKVFVCRVSASLSVCSPLAFILHTFLIKMHLSLLFPSSQYRTFRVCTRGQNHTGRCAQTPVLRDGSRSGR